MAVRPTIRLAALLPLLSVPAAARAADPVPIGPLGGFASSVVVDPADDDVVLVTKTGGLFRSLDGGASFAPFGAGLPSNVSGLATDPKDAARLYVHDGGQIYASDDFGATWTPLGSTGSGLRSISASPSADRILATTSSEVWLSVDGGSSFGVVATGTIVDPVAFAPSDGQVAYYGSIDGVFRSTDGGQSFSDPGPFSGWAQALTVAPDDADLVLVGTNAGAHRSTDGAATFVPMTGGLPGSANAEFFAYEPDGGRVWYALLSGLYLSDDDGLTWQNGAIGLPAQPPIPTGLAFSTGGDGFLTGEASGGGLYRTFGGVPPWEYVGFNEQPIVDVVFASAGGARVAASFNGVYAAPAGATLTPTSFQFDLGANTAVLAADPSDPTRWLSGGVGAFLDNAQVVVLSSNGTSFSKTYEQFGAGRVVALEFDPNDASTVVGGIFPGTFGNAALIHSDDAGASWSPVAGTAGWATRSVAFDPHVPGRVLQLSDNGQWAESLDSGASWGALQPAWPVGGPTVFLAFDPFEPGVLYLGDVWNGVQRSPDGGATWNPLGVAVNADSEIVLASGTPGLLWVSDEDGDVLVSGDGGATFDVAFTAPSGASTGLALDESDGTLLVGTSASSAWEIPGASPYVHLGGATSGTAGVPRHFGLGDLPSPGSAGWGLGGDGVLPGATAFLQVGLTELAVPVLGGTLWTFPPYVASAAAAASGDGAFSVVFGVPANPALPGLSIVSQFAFLDPGAASPSGVVLGPGLRTTLVP